MVKFIERIKMEYPYDDSRFMNRRKAEEDLMATGKYATVSCGGSSYDKKKDVEVIDCLAVKSLTDDIRSKLKITSEEQEDDITNIMVIYAVEPCEKNLSPDEFIKKHLKDEPFSSVAVSNVERNMYSAGMDAEMLRCCINPYDKKQTDKINKQVSRNISRTPYTNWSGD